MSRDWNDFVLKRCEKELQKNLEYLNLQNKLIQANKDKDLDTYSEITYKMQIIIMEVCYKLAVKDMIYIEND